MTHSDPNKSKKVAQRVVGVDIMRGIAMLWMTLYHFCFDLQYFGYIHQNFYNDLFWLWQRVGIVSLFLICAGMSQTYAASQGQPWRRFWRRWTQIVLCAAVVSVVSAWMFPHRWISFGVLHGIALMSLLLRWLLTRGWLRPWASALLGAILVTATPFGAQWLHRIIDPSFSAALDSRWWYWLGLVSTKPSTEDYVPLLPWFGVMLMGVAAIHFGLFNRLGVCMGVIAHGLTKLGRWSLSYYMLHQPVLFSLLMLWRVLTGHRA